MPSGLKVLILAFLLLCGVASGQDRPESAGSSRSASPACWLKTFTDRQIFDVIADGSSIYVLRSGGFLQAVALNGDSLWSAELGGEPVGIVTTKDGPVVLTSQVREDGSKGVEQLRLLSRQTGLTMWTVQIAQPPTSGLFGAGDLVVTVGVGGTIVGYRVGSGSVEWAKDLKGTPTAAGIQDKDLYVATAGSRLVDISLTDGRMSAESRPSSSITTIYRFPDGLFVKGYDNGRIIGSETLEDESSWELRNGARVSSLVGAGGFVIATSFDNFVYALTDAGNIRWKRRLSGRLTGDPAVGNSVLLVPAANEGSAYALSIKNGKVIDRLKTYNEGEDGRLVVRSLGEDRFVVADSNTLRIYSPQGCGVKNKKQP